MISENAGAASVAAGGTATGAKVVESLFGFDPYFVAFMGVGFTSVGMAAAGAMLSFAFGNAEKSKGKLIFTFLAATFIGAAGVTGVPTLFHLDPIKPEAQPVVAFFYALFARWAMPVFLEVFPTLFRRWLNLPAKAEG